MVMVGRAVGGDAVQHILRDIAHKIRGDVPDRLLLPGTAHDFGGFQYSGNFLMLLKPYWLKRAKNAVLIDGL